MSKRRGAALIAALALGALLAACGGEGDGTETAAISKRAFLRQANAICEASFEMLDARFERETRKRNEAAQLAAQIEFIASELPPALEKEVDEIRALGAPSGDEDQVSQFLAAVKELADTAASAPESFFREKNQYFKSSMLANEYGLYPCPMMSGLY